MPPRKKARAGSSKVASTPSRDSSVVAETSGKESPPKQSPEEESPEEPPCNPLADPWTDEQETSLFKGLIRWKPAGKRKLTICSRNLQMLISRAGMHKHFRMIALSEHLRNHGYKDAHTRIPGIWAKLNTLYNLEIIDANENRLDFGDDDDEDEDEGYTEFQLPEEKYDEECFTRGRRREDSETRSSPPRIDEKIQPVLPPPSTTRKRRRGEQASTRASTVDDTDEAGTSPAPPSSVRGSVTRRGRGRERQRGTTNLRSSVDRGASKDTETAAETEQESVAETGDDEGGDNTTAEETADEGSPSPRASRVRGRGRGGSGRGGRGKRGKKRGK